MTRISVRDAEARLSELIRKLKPGDEVLITEDDRPVARLIPAAPARAERRLGTLKGTVAYMAPDFDAPLDEFGEYME